MHDIVILGGGGHAFSIADSIIRAKEFNIVGYTDIKEDCLRSSNVMKYLGTDNELETLYTHDVKYAAIGVGFLGNNFLRDKLYTILKTIGFTLPVIIDPSACISSSSKIGEGTFIGKNAIINIGTVIEKMCIINSHATVDHDCAIGAFTHISVGVNLCGNVKIGDHSLIGAGSTIIQGLHIGSNAIVGAGSVVINDVKDKTKTYGVAAITRDINAIEPECLY